MVEVPIYWANAVLMIKPGTVKGVLNSDRIRIVFNFKFTSVRGFYNVCKTEELKCFFPCDSFSGLRGPNCSFATYPQQIQITAQSQHAEQKMFQVVRHSLTTEQLNNILIGIVKCSDLKLRKHLQFVEWRKQTYVKDHVL